MREHASWSVNLGRWGDCRVRLHMFFLLFGACTLYLGWLVSQTGDQPEALWMGLASLGILSVSVALHVLAHVYVSHQLDIRVESIVVGPLGDLGPDRAVGLPRNQLLVALAGPAMNLLLVLICLPVLMMLGHRSSSDLLHPLEPVGLTDGDWILVSLKLTTWINWLLALINLLPAFPFDGGRIARAALQLIRPGMTTQRASRIVTRTAKVAAIALLLFAWLSVNMQPTALVPPWFALCVLAILLYFAAQHEESRSTPPREGIVSHEDRPFGYDFSQGYTSLERSGEEVHFDEAEDSGALERWIDHRRATRRRRQEEIEAAEDALVDEILARVHHDGMQSLTPDERSLLERASMRYRSREEH